LVGSGGYILQKDGDRKRRSVRGCIVSREIAVVNFTILKRGKEPIPDITDKVLPRRLGPKRANNIRKLFDLEKKDDVRQFVVRREVPSKKEGGKPVSKAPKIQRLITPDRLQRKRRRATLIRKQREHSKTQAAAYAALLAQRKTEKRAALLSKKSRASARVSQRKSEKKVVEKK
jgi:small subunit ribosomal protein S6e